MKVDEAELGRRMEAFKKAAREAGVKLTHQRLEIFREIAGSLEHPDAETIFKAVQPRMPTVSLDTVYRTLWMLNELDLVSTLGPRRESIRFDANLRPHHHYVCVRCGLTRDFEAPVFDEQAMAGAVKGFGSVVASQVEVRGICENCSKAVAAADTSVRHQPR
ncbi:MAG: transcriptional repressor [Spirochaetes bacterium RIFOXYC1_FULL_54_7]|nr:MAG: transcriptional repressor [Spirochaetes bacterium RIFOXYC1_FULL_54_7]